MQIRVGLELAEPFMILNPQRQLQKIWGFLQKHAFSCRKMHFPAGKCGFRGAHRRKPQEITRGFKGSRVKNASQLSQEKGLPSSGRNVGKWTRKERTKKKRHSCQNHQNLIQTPLIHVTVKIWGVRWGQKILGVFLRFAQNKEGRTGEGSN